MDGMQVRYGNFKDGKSLLDRGALSTIVALFTHTPNYYSLFYSIIHLTSLSLLFSCHHHPMFVTDSKSHSHTKLNLSSMMFHVADLPESHQTPWALRHHPLTSVEAEMEASLQGL
jgi:hypothetical protein